MGKAKKRDRNRSWLHDKNIKSKVTKGGIFYNCWSGCNKKAKYRKNVNFLNLWSSDTLLAEFFFSGMVHSTYEVAWH